MKLKKRREQANGDLLESGSTVPFLICLLLHQILILSCIMAFFICFFFLSSLPLLILPFLSSQQIQTKTNDIIEGVFTTFSPNFDLVLDMAHPVLRADPAFINPETIKRKMIFAAADIVTIKVANVDLEYATRGESAFRLLMFSEMACGCSENLHRRLDLGSL